MELVILALAGFAYVVWRIETCIANAPLMPAEADFLDTLDGAHQHYYVMDLTREFYQCDCGHQVNRAGAEL